MENAEEETYSQAHFVVIRGAHVGADDGILQGGGGRYRRRSRQGQTGCCLRMGRYSPGQNTDASMGGLKKCPNLGTAFWRGNKGRGFKRQFWWHTKTSTAPTGRCRCRHPTAAPARRGGHLRTPAELGAKVALFDTQVVFCDAPAPAGPGDGPAWAELPVETGRPTRVWVGDRLWETGHLSLEGLLGVVTRPKNWSGKCGRPETPRSDKGQRLTVVAARATPEARRTACEELSKAPRAADPMGHRVHSP